MMSIETLLNDLRKNKKKIFGIHGGGNIGLGCMADIVANSLYQYHIVATSSDEFTNNLINSAQQFHLQHHTSQATKPTCIKNITMIYSRKRTNILWLYKHADLLALCVTEKAIANIVSDIAAGLSARYESEGTSLKILILMNRSDCDKLVQSEITKALNKLTRDTNYTKKILSSVQFIPTVADRIVSKIDKKNILNQLKNQLVSLDQQTINKFPNLFDLKKSLQEQIETILINPNKLNAAIRNLNLQFHLFNAEYHFLLYVPENFHEFNRLPNVKLVKNLKEFAEIKNKYINGPHAMLAWMGGLMGCKTIAEAINNPSMLWFISNLMEKEIGPILKAEYPTITVNELNILKNLFIRRCKGSLVDPIIRVGRDPLRKMDRGGRIRGIIELRQKHNLKIPTPELEKGIAAGVLYAINKIDPNNEECQKIREIYHQSNSYREVLCYKGPYGNGIYGGLDLDKDRPLINKILERIVIFEKMSKVRHAVLAKTTHKTRFL